MSFRDFDNHCVQVFSAATNPTNFAQLNTFAESKLQGDLTHTDEAFDFELPGIDPQFASTTTAVIGDGQAPAPGDPLYAITLDDALVGPIANDLLNNDPTTGIRDLHGFGLVTLEWANLVQHYMQTAYGVTTELGDPRCLGLAPGASPPKGTMCSGLEGVVTTAPAALVKLPQQQVNALGTLALQTGPMVGGTPAGASMIAGLHPGQWTALFCSDAGGIVQGVPSGYQRCVGGTPLQAHPASYFAAMQQAIAQTGNFGSTPAQLPPRDLGNPSFYFQQWMLALVHYLQSADNPGATLAQIDANPTDPNEMVVATTGGDVETAEYIFRNDVNAAMQPPLAVDVTADLTLGAITHLRFGRYDFRGEKALYTALTVEPTDLPGAENLYLTNLVGSPLLVQTFGSYACAINPDPLNAACGMTGIQPGSGSSPQFVGYEGAFGQSVFDIAGYGSLPTPSALTLDTSSPPRPAGHATLTLPVWSNPFDPTTAIPGNPTVSALVPYLPLGAGGGIPITIDGSRDKFYDTAQIVLTGNTVNATVDLEWVPFADADGGLTNSWVIRGVESSNFLGLVFACVQANATTGAPDVLAVRMNDGAGVVLDYLAEYPQAVANCNVLIRYSPYGNAIEAFTSAQYGVRLGFTSASWGSVVGDVILFDPNLAATTGQ